MENILPGRTQPSNWASTILILSNGQWIRLPQGQDPDKYRHLLEAELAQQKVAPLASPGCAASPEPQAVTNN